VNLLFDLDGTLTDPYLGISRCIAHAMEHVETPLPDGSDCRAFIGPPLQQTFLTLCGDTEKAAAALTAYRDRFAAIGLYENELYPGIPEMLASLGDHPLFVCTSKPTAYATRIVEHFGLARYFVAVYGSELDGTRADKGDLVAWILETEGLGPENCLMVGDRIHDIVGAAKNGVPALGVLWGYGRVDEFAEAGPQATIDRPEDLEPWLRGTYLA